MLFANNANTTLASSLTNVATTMSVTSASAFPSPTGSQYFYCTLADAATQTTIEIVKVTAVSGTTFTIVRGQDGTSATAFASGAVVSLRLVRASLNDFPKLDETNTFTQLQTINTIAVSGSTSTTPVLSFNASNCPIASGTAISGSYLQFVLQNTSGTAGASTNYVLSNDLGTDSTYYGEFGMNSSVYSSGTPADFFSLNNGIYYSGHDGDITVGSGNGKKLYLAWGTTGQSAHVINATGAIGLNTSITGSTNFGTSGQVLTSAGSGATPTWTTPTTGTVTSVAATAPAFLSISGSPITGSGTLAISYSGTALPVANGGTGLTTLTAGYIPYGNGTSAFNSSSGLYFDGTNLGIGTTSPATKLNVNGGRADFYAGSNSFSIGVAYNSSSGNYYIGATTGASPSLVFSDSTATERMRIDSGGNVSIGTSSQLYSGKQSIQYASNSGRGLAIYDSTIQNNSTFIAFLSGTSTAVGSITANGTTGVLYNLTSDYRLKENVALISNGLNTILALNPVTFTWISDKSSDSGFIAHEFQEIIPRSVTGKKDGLDKDGNPEYQGMDSTGAVPFLVAAIQELSAKFDAYVASHP